MPSPAVPQNVSRLYGEAKRGDAPLPPGYLFNLYFEIWKTNSWEIEDDGPAKQQALQSVAALTGFNEMQSMLCERQKSLAASIDKGSRLTVSARATAPFVTGTGLEHPVENGFSFLLPYGLPYLAGSSVKGVLRKAAEDMAATPEKDVTGERRITPQVIEALFGTDNQDPRFSTLEPHELKRGALTFWDVHPVAPKGHPLLRVDMMAPHHGDYLQGADKTKTPHGSEQVIPISFLTIAKGSHFYFTVTCDVARLRNQLGKQELETDWKCLVNSLFLDAFSFLGFGAKTSVGYGAMTKLNGAAANDPAESQEPAHVSAGKQWVEQAIGRLKTRQIQDVLFNKVLAEAWHALADGEEKEQALKCIQSRWGERWKNPGGKGARKALAIYKGETVGDQ